MSQPQPTPDVLRQASLRVEAEAVLRRHWGHARFRGGQWEAIEAALAGQDVLAILPTGGGKSVCYQVPALLGDGLTLVVSPLIALMQDQVAGLRAHGIAAAFINSTLSAREIDQRWTDAEFGRYRLLYVAPERLQTDVFLARAERLNVALLAVDEAHCISEWGHHFRPSYLQIAEGRARLGDPPTMAVTATATPDVRRDIVRHLALRNLRQVVKGFDRPNLVWSIFRTENKSAKVLEVIRGVPGSGVLYAATRRGTEEWAARLANEGESAAAYHGGLRSDVRAERQEAWLRGETRLMVATNAFGMGIDKPDVRFVIHVDVPGTLEAYYQEAGRAGRDGQTAYAVLLFQAGDEVTQRALIEDGYPDAQAVRAVYDAACSLAQLPIGALPDGPVAVDAEKVARVAGVGPGKVKRAIELLIRQEVWQALPAHGHRGYVRFETSAEVVRRYADSLRNPALARFVDELLRTVHADAFSDWRDIDVRLLQRRTGLGRNRLVKGLAFLEERGFLRWQPPGTATLVQFAAPRTARLPVDDVAVRRAKRRAERQLDHMLRYARSVTCRRHFLLAYFGEVSPERCGRCDVCLGRHRAVVVTPADEPVMRHLLHQIEKETPREAWFENDAPPHHLDGLLDWLLQEGYLRADDPLEETFRLTPKAQAFMKQWAPRDS